MTDKILQEWETIDSENPNLTTLRLLVSSGYIYCMKVMSEPANFFFVPDFPICDSRIANEPEFIAKLTAQLHQEPAIEPIAPQINNEELLKQAYAELKEQRMKDVNQFNKNIQDSAINHAQLYAKVNDYNQKLLNQVAELSLKINKQQSDMREFEKERINPKFEQAFIEIQTIKEVWNRDVNAWQSQHKEMLEHIENLEFKVQMCENADIQECIMVRKFLNEINERIEKLEKDRLIDIVGRIENLEAKFDTQIKTPDS